MYGIDILLEEHENILKFIDYMEDRCIEVMNGEKIDYDLFRKAISFVREYADGHHHKKEEDIIFKYMLENLGEEAEFLVKNGMMVEHDLARLKMLELEKALEAHERDGEDIDKLAIITNMMSYVYLLRRHIDKENRVVYTYAERNLPGDILEKIDKETRSIEENEEEMENVDRHIEFLNSIL